MNRKQGDVNIILYIFGCLNRLKIGNMYHRCSKNVDGKNPPSVPCLEQKGPISRIPEAAKIRTIGNIQVVIGSISQDRSIILSFNISEFIHQ